MSATDPTTTQDKDLAFWQPRFSRKLTTEDARLMTERVVDFFGILAEWEAKAGSAQPSPGDTYAP